MNRNLLYSFIVILSFACSSGKKASYADLMEKAPSWVTQVPNNPMYYHGIGMATKSTNQDYREIALRNALSEIAGSISVNISSSSVLNMFESDNTYNEFYRDNIKYSTTQFLEGYELVENWENDQQYWVYYRLSKSRYEQIKQDRISSALNQSLSKYHEARNLGSQGRIGDALGFYVRSIEDIRDFLAEEIKAEIDGEQKVYSTVLMSDLMNQLESLQFDFQLEKLNLKPGPLSTSNTLNVVLKDNQGRPVAGVPVITSYSWQPGKFIESVTDSRGTFRLNPQGIVPGRRSELISCHVDMKKLTRGASHDMMVQRLFSTFNTNIFTLPLEIVPPACFVSLKNNGEYDISSIRDDINRLLQLEGIDLAQDTNVSDLVLDSEVSLVNLSKVGNRYTSNIKASFILSDSNRTIQYSSRTDNATGIGTTPSEAWDDALKSLRGNFKISVYPALINDTFRRTP